MDSPEKWLEKWSQSSRKNFERNHRIKSFGEYLKDLKAAPYSLTRNAVQYVVDMIESFGEEKVYSTGELLRRFKLFSLPLPRTAIPPLVGNEEAVLDLYSALKNFVIEGRVDRIIHLHGPSGSGKSLIVDWLMKGCEEYSRKKEGTLYTFRWVFPAEEGKRMGFGETPSDEDSLPTYAYLSGEEISFRLACDLNDSPLLLIPPKRRMPFLQELLPEADEAERNKFIPTKHILEDDLCPRCREVFDALHDEYGGDVEKILRHVQVKRLHISRKYQKGAAVISPQETPDATSRLLSTDSNLESIPPVLQYLTMEQLGGNLVNGNNGIVEFSDCLSRSPELNKYLLSAADRGSVEVSRSLISLNLVPMASSNEESLESFKQSPDFPPFKGITIFVPVPYLLERSKEQRIYIDTLAKIGNFKHVAPYLAEEAGLWSILTRLHKPEAENYPKEMRDVVSKVGPYEKACLYDSFTLLVPGLCNFDIETVEILSSLREEFKGTQFYEGRFGVAPREMAQLFYNEAYNRETGCIGIFDFLEGLNSMIKDQSLLKFLQLKPENGYHDPAAFQNLIKKEYLELFENDLLVAMKIYPEGGTLEIVDAYFNSIMENREDDRTKEYEKMLAGDRNQNKYRAEIASAMEKGLKRSEWGFIPKFIEEARNFEARLKKGNENCVSSVLRSSMDLLAGGENNVKPDCLEKSKKFIETMMENFGYCPHCLFENIKVILDDKYS